MKAEQNRINQAVLQPLLLSLLLFICSRPGLAATEPGQSEIDSIGDSAVSILLEQRPDLAEKFKALPGYAVIGMSAIKIPAVGTGLGYGVVVDSRSDTRSYIKVTQFEVGGGFGTQKYRVIILFKDEALLDRMIKGGWRFERGADFAAEPSTSEKNSVTSDRSGKGYKVFRLTESGMLATITIRLLSAKPYLVN